MIRRSLGGASQVPEVVTFPLCELDIRKLKSRLADALCFNLSRLHHRGGLAFRSAMSSARSLKSSTFPLARDCQLSRYFFAFFRLAVFFAAFAFFAFAFFAIAALLAMMTWRCRISAYANRKHCIPITTERRKKHGYRLRKCV